MLVNWELPSTVTALRSFLAFTNYYHSYIPNYAEYAAPLSEKLKLDKNEGKRGSQKAVIFNYEEIECFHRLKSLLVSGLEVLIPNPDRPFMIRVDASRYAVGAVLEQNPDSDATPPTVEAALAGRLKPVGFFSRKLTSGQRRS